MGACTFTNTVVAKTAHQAFDQVTSDARYEYGHGGYTGTIAEKHGFRELVLPEVPGMSPDEVVTFVLNGIYEEDGADPWTYTRYGRTRFVDGKLVTEPNTAVTIPPACRDALRRISRAVDDKWGDAGCFDITDTPEGREALDRWLSMQERTGAFEVNGRTGVRTLVGPKPNTKGQRVFLFFGWASS